MRLNLQFTGLVGGSDFHHSRDLANQHSDALGDHIYMCIRERFYFCIRVGGHGIVVVRYLVGKTLAELGFEVCARVIFM